MTPRLLGAHGVTMAALVSTFRSIISEIRDFVLIFPMKFHEDFTPILTNIDISEP